MTSLKIPLTGKYFICLSIITDILWKKGMILYYFGSNFQVKVNKKSNTEPIPFGIMMVETFDTPGMLVLDNFAPNFFPYFCMISWLCCVIPSKMGREHKQLSVAGSDQHLIGGFTNEVVLLRGGISVLRA